MTWRDRTVPHGPETTRPITSCRTSPADWHAQCRGDARVAVTQRAAYAETTVVLTIEGHADQVYELGGDDARNFETVAAAFAEAPSPVSSAVRLLPGCRCSSHSPEPRRPSGSRPGVDTCFTHRPGWDGDDGVGGYVAPSRLVECLRPVCRMPGMAIDVKPTGGQPGTVDVSREVGATSRVGDRAVSQALPAPANAGSQRSARGPANHVEKGTGAHDEQPHERRPCTGTHLRASEGRAAAPSRSAARCRAAVEPQGGAGRAPGSIGSWPHLLADLEVRGHSQPIRAIRYPGAVGSRARQPSKSARTSACEGTAERLACRP